MNVVMQRISKSVFLLKVEGTHSAEWKGGKGVDGMPWLRVAEMDQEVFVKEGENWIQVFPVKAKEYAIKTASALGFRVGI